MLIEINILGFLFTSLISQSGPVVFERNFDLVYNFVCDFSFMMIFLGGVFVCYVFKNWIERISFTFL